jgi:cobyric acid synthase CobQ
MAFGNKSLLAQMRALRLPWSVNALAQEAAKHLYSDKKYISRSIETNAKNRERLISELSKIPGITTLPSHSNFVLCKLKNSSSLDLQRKLLLKGILIRSCSEFPSLGDSFIRLAARPEDETEKLISALSDVKPDDQSKQHAKAMMFVGTASNSGKSVTTAAFGRYFSRLGIKTMPFKAQNMALNSFVTKDGGEMGRAQVVQAAACKVEPHTDMNPVLLKPLGNAESQIIINGKAVSNMSARDYYKNKDSISKEAFSAFDRLKDKCELILMEGAGSPAEINLQDEDFVNMRMAAHAKAPVILVADIDRGGVFASIYGTLKLIKREYKYLVKGVIINKFRGDKSLLGDGIEQIEKLTGIPVLGIMPHLENLNIEDEDSVGLEGRSAKERKLIDIAIVRLPKISNYTDFLALEMMKNVSVRYVSNARKLGDPDLIIIPGTKNTISDMIFLKESGIQGRLIAARKKNIPIIGICGGYQMLGKTINDPSGIEGKIRNIEGLGFLDATTELEAEKELAQVEGVSMPGLPFTQAGTSFKGYEIHAGKTSCSTANPPLKIEKRSDKERVEPAGALSDDGLVFGCYIHGIFDSEPLRRQLFEWLCKRKGVSPSDNDQTIFADAQEDSFNRLAEALETNIDMNRIKKILNL